MKEASAVQEKAAEEKVVRIDVFRQNSVRMIKRRFDMAEVILNESNFEEEVIYSPIPVLVDFWAEWCGPCKMLGPVISTIAEKYDGKIKVCKLNVDDCMSIAEQYFIESIPAVKSLLDLFLNPSLSRSLTDLFDN